MQETKIKVTRLLSTETIRGCDQDKIANLLIHGADINSTDEYNRTALWWAAFKGNSRLVKFLIENGAKLTEDIHGQSPLDVAREQGSRGYREVGEESSYPEIVNLLSTQPFIITKGMQSFGIHAKRNMATEAADKEELSGWGPQCTLL